MLSLRIRWAACVAACLLSAGCCGALRCGGPSCGDGCTKKSPYAFMKYKTCCETCGCGFCSSCNQGCGCGNTVTCGANCDGQCAKSACQGCGTCGCGKQTPCWLLNAFCTCAGCGERYWNEWYNDPPRCCEPCDCYGNWVGPGHGGSYRAPYLNDPYLMGKGANVAPLEVAETEPVDESADLAADETAGAESLQQSEAVVDAAAVAAAYDDDDLATGLK